MEILGDWVLLLPLVTVLLVLLYTGWQAFKEIKPTLLQIKKLQQQIQKTKQTVNTLITEVQSTRGRAARQAEVVQGLIEDSRETYDRVKEGVRVLASVNTLPVRQGINYIKQFQQDRRLPKGVRSIKRKASQINAKLNESEFIQLPALLGLIVSAAALILVFRSSRSRI
jgi:predicted Holliday junction resolvase-like endonuclease